VRETGAAQAEVSPRDSVLGYILALPRTRQFALACASGAVVVGSFVRFGVSGHAVVAAIFAAALVLLAAIDLDRRVLPNVIVLPALGLVLALQIVFDPGRTLEWVLAALGAALFLFIPLLIYPAGMGMGDVKLAALLGAALGKAVAGAIAAGLIAAGLVALVVLAREGLGARKKAIAFGPLLAFGGLLALFLGGR
jgi:leader peptidase (prepilin peptidase)/N-methyltransferase